MVKRGIDAAQLTACNFRVSPVFKLEAFVEKTVGLAYIHIVGVNARASMCCSLAS